MPKQRATHRDLCQLEGYLAGMAHNPCPDLDQAALDAGERPVRDVFGQVGTLEEAPHVVSQRMKLKSDLIIAEPFAG